MNQQNDRPGTPVTSQLPSLNALNCQTVFPSFMVFLAVLSLQRVVVEGVVLYQLSVHLLYYRRFVPQSFYTDPT